MPEIINLYGDQRKSTVTGHGIDVASQRADDLDLLAIAHVQALIRNNKPVSVLDAGCGHGGQVIRMAKAGARVLGMDMENYGPLILHEAAMEAVFEQVEFHCTSVTDEPDIGQFDLILCQRMIHYLPHAHALAALRWFHRISNADGCLFISASGLDSELGTDYEGRETSVENRLHPLSPPMANKHSIFPPVCLYRKEELVGLVTQCGWNVEKAFLSPFGNIKIVAKKEGGA